jgi:hypothetical protein
MIQLPVHCTSIPVTVKTCFAMAQVVSHRPLTMDARVHVQVSPCGFCGEHSGTGTDFHQVIWFFLCQYHTTVALHTHMRDEQ